MKYYVLIATTCGNPDHGQHPGLPKYNTQPLNTRVTAEDYREKLDSWTAENDLGGGNIDKCILVDAEDTSKVCARVSFNGRLWPPHTPWFSGQKALIFDQEGILHDPNEKDCSDIIQHGKNIAGYRG